MLCCFGELNVFQQRGALIKLMMMTVWVVLPPRHCYAALWICFLFFSCYLCTFYLLLWCYVSGMTDMCYSTTLAELYQRNWPGAWGTVGQDSSTFSSLELSQGLAWQDKLARRGGGRRRNRKREPCWHGEGEMGELCQLVSLPVSPSWVSLPSVLHWAGRRRVHSRQSCQRGAEGRYLGRVSDLSSGLQWDINEPRLQWHFFYKCCCFLL